MQHLDEGTSHAWLDGELPLAEREAVEAHVAQCALCAAAIAEARGFIAASSRILMALDAVPGGVLPAPQSPPAKNVRVPAKFTLSRRWMAAAAVLVLSTVTVIAVRPRHDDTRARLAMQKGESENSRVANVPAPKPADELTQSRVDKTSVRARVAEPTTRSAERPSALNSVVVTGAGTTASADKDGATMEDTTNAARLERHGMTTLGGVAGGAEKLGAVVGPVVEAPEVVSRITAKAHGDTIVTTVYSVNGVPVSLIDRSSGRYELRRQAKVSFSDQPMAKSRDNATSINSITWFDSTGRIRTLRGAVSRADLERLKAALFGPTP